MKHVIIDYNLVLTIYIPKPLLVSKVPVHDPQQLELKLQNIFQTI